MTKAMTPNARVTSVVVPPNAGESFERLKAELVEVFAAPDREYRPLSADVVIAGNARRQTAKRPRH